MTSLQGYADGAAAASSMEPSSIRGGGLFGPEAVELAASAPVTRPRGYTDAHLATRRCGRRSGALGDPAFYAAATVTVVTGVLVGCTMGWLGAGAVGHAAGPALVNGIDTASSRSAEIETTGISAAPDIDPTHIDTAAIETAATPAPAPAEEAEGDDDAQAEDLDSMGQADRLAAAETDVYLPPSFRAKAVDPRIARPPSPDDPIERAPPETAPRPPVRWAAAVENGEQQAVSAPWRRHAQPPPPAAEVEDAPVLAIVIDDLGFDLNAVKRLLSLPAPVTLAVLPYAPNAEAAAKLARQSGRELLAHVPMQPVGGEDPGPNALRVDLPLEENLRRLDANLAIFSGYVGVNNHMGSAVTANAEIMREVLAELNRRGLMYLDSRTANDSWGWRLAERMKMPAAVNHVFLDNVREPEAVRRWLDVAARQARERGAAVAIGHPHEATLEALEAWLKADGPGDVTLAPISTVAERLLAARQDDGPDQGREPAVPTDGDASPVVETPPAAETEPSPASAERP